MIPYKLNYGYLRRTSGGNPDIPKLVINGESIALSSDKYSAAEFVEVIDGDIRELGTYNVEDSPFDMTSDFTNGTHIVKARFVLTWVPYAVGEWSKEYSITISHSKYLAPPTNLRYNKTANKITWDAVQGATKYKVDIWCLDDDEFSCQPTVTTNEVDLSDAEPETGFWVEGNIYVFDVQAANEDNESEWSEDCEFVLYEDWYKVTYVYDEDECTVSGNTYATGYLEVEAWPMDGYVFEDEPTVTGTYDTIAGSIVDCGAIQIYEISSDLTITFTAVPEE